ncbi:MAG: short-chain dehydrogenase [Pseudonocardiales bacterium]|nr:short-chain dehydrogenase [Pseudonocardiales bacterium]
MTETDISVLVTGPTRGLGRALVGTLGVPGPRLVLAGRPGVGDVAAATGGRAVPLDLADLGSVRSGAASVVDAVAAGALPPLGAVVANAGLQVTDRRRRSADGHELTFAVNVLAQHQLLRSLEPALAPGAHLVLLGSGTHWGGRRSMGLVAAPRWEDPLDLARADLGADAGTRVAGQRAYATSKLAIVLLAHAWQRRHPELRVNVYDPGLMPGTGLARDMSAARRWAWRRVLPVLRVLPGVTTPAASARHLADFALGRVHADLRGGYVELGRVTRSSPASHDRAAEDRLWEVAEQLTAPGGTRRPRVGVDRSPTS